MKPSYVTLVFWHGVKKDPKRQIRNVFALLKTNMIMASFICPTNAKYGGEHTFNTAIG